MVNSKTKLYKVWTEMKRRCNNPHDKVFHDYGGRGIRYCSEWEKFKPFSEWAYANGYFVGERGECTLDRIDVNGDYCPENCRWISQSEQSKNKRTTVWLVVDGIKHTLREWSDISGIPMETIRVRINKYGYTPKEAVFTPIGKPIKKLIYHNGEKLHLNEWARRTGINSTTIGERLHRGWSVEKALTEPVQKKTPRTCVT